MALLDKIKVNTINTDLANYYYFLQGVEKVGKTTFFRDLILTLYNGDVSKGLLLAVGNEKGYKALDNIQAIDIETWTDFVALIKELIETKNQTGIRFLCIDTYDELVELAEKEVLRLSRVETGKPCKTLNSALGGYGAGRKRLCQIVDEQLSLLHKYYGVLVVGHTKIKTVKEQGVNEEQEYQVLDCNLNKDYANVVAHKADVIMTAVIEREVVDGRIRNLYRNLYFRGNCFVVAGSRFPNIPDKVEFTAKNFIDTITKAIQDSRTTDVVSPKIENKVETHKEPQNEVIEKKNDISEPDCNSIEQDMGIIESESIPTESKINVERNKILLIRIQNSFKQMTPQQKADVKEVLTKHGYTKFDVDTMDTTIFEEANSKF